MICLTKAHDEWPDGSLVTSQMVSLFPNTSRLVSSRSSSLVKSGVIFSLFSDAGTAHSQNCLLAPGFPTGPSTHSRIRRYGPMASITKNTVRRVMATGLSIGWIEDRYLLLKLSVNEILRTLGIRVTFVIVSLSSLVGSRPINGSTF